MIAYHRANPHSDFRQWRSEACSKNGHCSVGTHATKATCDGASGTWTDGMPSQTACESAPVNGRWGIPKGTCSVASSCTKEGYCDTASYCLLAGYCSSPLFQQKSTCEDNNWNWIDLTNDETGCKAKGSTWYDTATKPAARARLARRGSTPPARQCAARQILSDKTFQWTDVEERGRCEAPAVGARGLNRR